MTMPRPLSAEQRMDSLRFLSGRPKAPPPLAGPEGTPQPIPVLSGPGVPHSPVVTRPNMPLQQLGPPPSQQSKVHRALLSGGITQDEATQAFNYLGGKMQGGLSPKLMGLLGIERSVSPGTKTAQTFTEGGVAGPLGTQGMQARIQATLPPGLQATVHRQSPVNAAQQLIVPGSGAGREPETELPTSPDEWGQTLETLRRFGAPESILSGGLDAVKQYIRGNFLMQSRVPIDVRNWAMGAIYSNQAADPPRVAAGAPLSGPGASLLTTPGAKAGGLPPYLQQNVLADEMADTTGGTLEDTGGGLPPFIYQNWGGQTNQPQNQTAIHPSIAGQLSSAGAGGPAVPAPAPSPGQNDLLAQAQQLAGMFGGKPEDMIALLMARSMLEMPGPQAAGNEAMDFSRWLFSQAQSDLGQRNQRLPDLLDQLSPQEQYFQSVLASDLGQRNRVPGLLDQLSPQEQYFQSVLESQLGQQAQIPGMLSNVSEPEQYFRAVLASDLGQRNQQLSRLLGGAIPAAEKFTGMAFDPGQGISAEAKAALRGQATTGITQQYDQAAEALRTELARRNALGGRLPASSGDILRGFGPLMASREAARSQANRDVILEDERQKLQDVLSRRQTGISGLGALGGLVSPVTGAFGGQVPLQGFNQAAQQRLGQAELMGQTFTGEMPLRGQLGFGQQRLGGADLLAKTFGGQLPYQALSDAARQRLAMAGLVGDLYSGKNAGLVPSAYNAAGGFMGLGQQPLDIASRLALARVGLESPGANQALLGSLIGTAANALINWRRRGNAPKAPDSSTASGAGSILNSLLRGSGGNYTDDALKTILQQGPMGSALFGGSGRFNEMFPYE